MSASFARVTQPLRRHPLETGIVISLLAHALVLTIHFVAPDTFRLETTDAPLEVVLVNARSANAPDKPSALAQANLAGGGEQDKERATSPLPAQGAEVNGSLVTRTQRQVAELEAVQQRLLTQTRESSYAADARVALAEQRAQDQPKNGQENETLEQKMSRLQAEIDRDLRTYQSRPKRGQVTANTREVVYARYYDALRRKIERLGTEHFPEIAGKRLYGELIVTLNVNQQGMLGYHKSGYDVTGIEVTRSSGNPELDRRAVSIVQASAPFGAFTPEMRARYDILEIITRMTFTREGVSATAIASPSR